jgi:hypothetical protein
MDADSSGTMPVGTFCTDTKHRLPDRLSSAKTPAEPDRVAITFDDGPDPEVDAEDSGNPQTAGCESDVFHRGGRSRKRGIPNSFAASLPRAMKSETIRLPTRISRKCPRR